MSEKILFKAKIVYTKEKMINYLESKIMFFDAILFVNIIALWLGLFYIINWDIFRGIVFLFIGLVYPLIRYNNGPKIEAQNFHNIIDEQYHTNEVNQEVSFTDNSIKIKNLTSWANGEMFYDQIIRLVDKKWFYGLIFRYSHIFIDKDCFTKWNELEFKEFINQKLCENKIKQKANRKQNKKLDSAFRASIIVLIIFFGIILWGSLLPESEDINNESEQSYASIEQIYQTLSADDGKIAEWYSIPVEFLEKHPDVVSLILNSISLKEGEEKQWWFDMFYYMDDNQINELRDILTREKEKLAEIEEKYNVKISEDYINNQENSWETL